MCHSRGRLAWSGFRSGCGGNITGAEADKGEKGNWGGGGLGFKAVGCRGILPRAGAYGRGARL